MDGISEAQPVVKGVLIRKSAYRACRRPFTPNPKKLNHKYCTESHKSLEYRARVIDRMVRAEVRLRLARMKARSKRRASDRSSQKSRSRDSNAARKH